MTTSIKPRAATFVRVRSPFFALTGVTTALRGVVHKVDAWLKERARAAADHDALARMRDRELLDIGLHHCAKKFVADDAWLRDCPY